jgi:hypothetical protein
MSRKGASEPHPETTPLLAFDPKSYSQSEAFYAACFLDMWLTARLDLLLAACVAYFSAKWKRFANRKLMTH